MKKNFIIAAGGTGMRCLQSFINMCALGMYPDEEIHILLLETDIENGDKKESEKLVNWFQSLNESSGGTKKGSDAPKCRRFFNVDIHFHVFVPDYSQDSKRRFTLISELEKGGSELNRQLANQFYSEDVQEFDLMHGFRAQTHLGSYLMYHAFIEELKLATASDIYRDTSDLYKFMTEIVGANKEGEARVFVLGSSFGGTGASSIPVMSRAIQDGAEILVDGSIRMENIFFGAVVLTPYFKFKSASKEHKKNEKVVADSVFFQHNSAAALMYYIKDHTLLTTYKNFYLLGWPFTPSDVDDYKAQVNGDNKGKTVTGGKKQKNPAHLVEFLSAFAARNFFFGADDETLRSRHEAEWRYKAIPFETENDTKIPYFAFDDVVTEKSNKGTEEDISKALKDRLTCLYAFGMYLHGSHDGSIEGFLENLKRYNVTYDLSKVQIEALDGYLNYLTAHIEDDKVIPGWLPQMWYSLGERNTNGEFLGYVADGLDLQIGNSKIPTDLFPKMYRDLVNRSTKSIMHMLISRWLKLGVSAGRSKRKGEIGVFFDDLLNVMSSFEVNSVEDKAKETR